VQELSGTTPTANLLSGSIDEIFQRTDASGASSFLSDALGSTLALADASGALQTTYTYGPFGSTTAAGSSSNSVQYTGRENDQTGLYYYRARYYDPQIGRFISEDPIGFWGGINFFGHVENDPINFTDPTGLLTIDPTFNQDCLPAHLPVWEMGTGKNSRP
jgi:RHS repeat-associated protein